MRRFWKWITGGDWRYSRDGSRRKNMVTGKVEIYEQCPSGWAGVWVPSEQPDQE